MVPSLIGFNVRVDKFLKAVGLLKRRTLAQALCEKGRVKIGERIAKPSSEVKPGDRLTLHFGNKVVSIVVTGVPERPVMKENRTDYYQVVSVASSFEKSHERGD